MESRVEQENQYSTDQINTAEHFRDLVGGMQLEDAIDILKNHDWNLEQAVNDFMGLGLSDNAVRHRGVPAAISLSDHSLPPIDLSLENDSSSNNNLLNSYHNWFSWTLGIIFSPFTFTYRIFSAISSFIYVTDPVGDVRRFIDLFNLRYTIPQKNSSQSNSVLPFYLGSYAEALKDARQSLRYLFVYIHGDSTKETDKFCKDVLCDPSVCEFLNDASELIFWGCNVGSPEGFRVSRSLRALQYPFIGIVGLSNIQSSSIKMALLGRVEGLHKPSDLISRLRTIMLNSSSALQNARFERSEIQASQRLRREQDEAYEQSLAMDRAKRDQRRAKEQAAEEAARIIQEKENTRLRYQRAFKKRAEYWANNLSPQSTPDSPNSVRLSVKMPNGQRFTHIFNILYSALYYFVLSQNDCPKAFKLQANFPKRFIDCHPSCESELEDYLSDTETVNHEFENVTIRRNKNINEDFWLPNSSKKDPASFKELDIIKPEVIFVIDEDA